MYGNPRGGTFYITEYLDVFGQSPQWDDLRFPASQLRLNPVTFKPDLAVWIGGLRILSFDPAAEEGVDFDAQLPHGFKYGTKLRFHVHWTPLAAPVVGETVRWGLEWSAAQSGEVFGGPFTLGPVSHTFVAGDAQNEHLRLDLGEIDVSAWTSLSGMLAGRVYRDATVDTWGGEAGLLEADFHFQKDTIGSTQEFVK